MLTLPSSRPQRVSDDEDARWLADYILSGTRRKPLLVITCRRNTQKTELDPDIIAALTGESVDIAVFGPDSGDSANSAFNKRLDAYGPASYGVYNGAARLYPVSAGLIDAAKNGEASNESSFTDAPIYYLDTKTHREHMLDDLTGRLVAAGLLIGKPQAAVIRQAARQFDEQVRHGFGFPEFENRNPARIIRTMTQTRELTDLLTSEERVMPIIVVAQSERRDEPFVDVDLISNTLHDLALVVVLRGDTAITEFERHIPRPAWVFGDAGRVFPAGTGWKHPDTPPRLFLPNEHVSRMLLTNLMIKDALINVAGTLRKLSALR